MQRHVPSCGWVHELSGVGWPVPLLFGKGKDSDAYSPHIAATWRIENGDSTVD